MADCWSSLGIRGPLVPDSPTNFIPYFRCCVNHRRGLIPRDSTTLANGFDCFVVLLQLGLFVLNLSFSKIGIWTKIVEIFHNSNPTFSTPTILTMKMRKSVLNEYIN